MQSASQTSSAETESNENLEDPRSSNLEVAQEAEVCPDQVEPVHRDPMEGTSASQDIEMQSDHQDQDSNVLASQKETPNDHECATCLVMANQNRQLKNQVKSLQEKLNAARKQRFSSRRTGNGVFNMPSEIF